MATLQWRSQHPLTDHEHRLFQRLLALMNSFSPDECEMAARATFEIYTGNDAPLAGETIRTLLSNRLSLSTACAAFSSTLPYQTGRLLPTTRAILAALAEDRLTIKLRVELIIQGLPWEEVAAELTKLVASLHADALERAKLIIQQASRRPDANLFDLEMALTKNDDERLRRLALAALVAQTQRAPGWSDEAIARLEQYRHDPSPLVAEAAQFTFPA